MSLTQLLFSFQGRLNRKPYWTMAITTTVVFILLLLLAVATLREYGLEFLLVTIAILVILYIPLIWIGLALGAKRLHDRDKSPWWLLLITIPVAGVVWYVIECGFRRGTDGNNSYGADPISNY